MIEMDPELPITTTLEVYDTCLCWRTQRAARALARHFDQAFRQLGLTHGQFSVMMSLNRPDAPTLSSVADLLGMDRTSLTAKLKPLVRDGLVNSEPDPDDRRSRRLSLTNAGIAKLKEAYPIWRAAHNELDGKMSVETQADFKTSLNTIGAL